MELKRLELKKELPYYMDSSNFEGELQKITDFLKTLPEKLLTQGIDSSLYYNFSIDTRNRSWDEGIEYVLYGWYHETDEQYFLRKNKIEEQKILVKKLEERKIKYKEENEKTEYLRLKAKFEK